MYLHALALGPLQKVRVYSGFFANGFKFNTLEHGLRRLTYNSGVCIKGLTYNTDELENYGRLLEIIEVEYSGSCSVRKISLFNCEWFDPSPSGTCSSTFQIGFC